MKKNLLFLAFALISLTVSAQHTTPVAKVQQQQIAVSAPLHFGYFSLIRFSYYAWLRYSQA